MVSQIAEAPYPDAASKNDEHRVLYPCGALLRLAIWAINMHCDLPILPQAAHHSLGTWLIIYQPMLKLTD